jgi:AAA+ superfamily predicted ATPase
MDEASDTRGVAMSTDKSHVNADFLERELSWFNSVLDARIALYFEHEKSADDSDASILEVSDITPPNHQGDESNYAELIDLAGIGFDERILLILALIPHIKPDLLDLLFTRNKNFDRGFTQFGGWKGQSHGGFLPTCETAAFLISGHDLKKRFTLTRYLEGESYLIEKGILFVEHKSQGEPFMSGALRVSTEYLNKLTSGLDHKPDYSIDFPAKLITSKLNWDDLVLSDEVMMEIENIITWINHSKTIMKDWGLEKVIKPGYRSLFYGPPGTGKTLTASLIGDTVGADVYRIDLSMVVSKYIGETEKNLANVFDQAESKNWILFFDEADALFGKRTQASSSNDRHANQEISYLLQRVEDFPGVVILASNIKANIDEAFSRRFQSVVYFPMPDAEHRLLLWKRILGNLKNLPLDISFKRLAESYELSGGAITNVVRYGAISTLQMKRTVMLEDDLVEGATRELRKEGKTV